MPAISDFGVTFTTGAIGFGSTTGFFVTIGGIIDGTIVGSTTVATVEFNFV